MMHIGAFKWGPIPFRFENIWLEDPEFKRSIESWWNALNPKGWAGFKFMENLKGLRTKIKEWNKESYDKKVKKEE